MISKKIYQFCLGDISKIENYDLAISDENETWQCHHRLEIEGDIRRSVREMQSLDLYYKRPPDELIFLKKDNHARLHMKGQPAKNKGVPISEKTRIKLRESHLGLKWSEESKRKISVARKGIPKSEETRRRMSESKKGEKNPQYGKRHTEEYKRNMSKRCKGINTWKKGTHCSDSQKEKISIAFRGMKFWNNGVICVRALECPNGFVRGRLPFKKNKNY